MPFLTAAVADLKKAGEWPKHVGVRSRKYLNHTIEPDHRRVKQRPGPMRGLQCFRMAAMVISGIRVGGKDPERAVPDRHNLRSHGNHAGNLAGRSGCVSRLLLIGEANTTDCRPSPKFAPEPWLQAFCDLIEFLSHQLAIPGENGIGFGEARDSAAKSADRPAARPWIQRSRIWWSASPDLNPVMVFAVCWFAAATIGQRSSPANQRGIGDGPPLRLPSASRLLCAAEGEIKTIVATGALLRVLTLRR
jgi:hypothetical protein